MNPNYDELRTLYRQARSDEEPTRSDKRAVRVALIGAGTAAATFHTATAAGRVLASIPGAGKVLTLGQVVFYTSIGVSVGGGLAAVHAAVSNRGPAIHTSVTTAHDEYTARAPGRAAAPAAGEDTAPLVASSIVANADGEAALQVVRSTDQPPRETVPSLQTGAGVRPRKAQPQAVAPISALRATPLPSLVDESRALGAVQSALNAHDAAGAIRLLDAQEREFAYGSLVQERAAARVLAFCTAGRTSEAQSARERFLQTYPGSPLVRRINTACTK